MMWRGRTGDFRPAAESWIVLYNGGRGRPEPPGMAGCGLGMGWEWQGLLPRTRAHLASGRRVQRVDVVRLVASLWGRRRGRAGTARRCRRTSVRGCSCAARMVPRLHSMRQTWSRRDTIAASAALSSTAR